MLHFHGNHGCANVPQCNVILCLTCLSLNFTVAVCHYFVVARDIIIVMSIYQW